MRALRVGFGVGVCRGAGAPRGERSGGRPATASAALHARVLRVPGAEHAEVRARILQRARLPRDAHRAPDAHTQGTRTIVLYHITTIATVL